ARLRHADRRGHAGGDPASPPRDRSLPGHRLRAGAGGPEHAPLGAVLDLADVHTYYGNIRALRGLSLSVERGEIVTLIGANGAGKTTTLRTILGLVRPRRGSVSFNGTRLDTMSTDRIVRLGIAQSPEGRHIFPRMSVLENLELGAFVRSDRDGIAPDLERVFALFPRLRERVTQKGGTLSGGEQQMLAISRALMARPGLLLLDEPSMGLSPILVETIFRIVQDINRQGTTILLVEQNARMALRVAHRGYVIQTGRIVLHDSAAALLRSDLVRKTYLGAKEDATSMWDGLRTEIDPTVAAAPAAFARPGVRWGAGGRRGGAPVEAQEEGGLESPPRRGSSAAARRSIALGVEAVETVRDFITREQIACDATPAGSFLVAHRA